MATGKVKWFNFRKGYGFITPDGSDKDIFVHISDVQKSGLKGLREDQIVEFEETQDEKGKNCATNISIKA